MRAMLCCLVIVLGASVATAQPGQTPYAPPPYAQPPPGVPAPYAYQPRPQVMLTDEERHLLEVGEISDGKHLGGGLAAVFFGFGVGQAVQGRWSDTGYIFTLGEGASVVALFYGLGRALSCDGESSCSNEGAGWMVGGLLAYTALHVWEIADAFVVPPRHNQRVRELRSRLGYPPAGMYYSVKPFLTPPKNGDGAVAGFELRF
jgi:hypothetical protein